MHRWHRRENCKHVGIGKDFCRSHKPSACTGGGANKSADMSALGKGFVDPTGPLHAPVAAQGKLQTCGHWERFLQIP